MRTNTSECLDCKWCEVEEVSKALVYVKCDKRGKKYHYGQFIECDEREKKIDDE